MLGIGICIEGRIWAEAVAGERATNGFRGSQRLQRAPVLCAYADFARNSEPLKLVKRREDLILRDHTAAHDGDVHVAHALQRAASALKPTLGDARWNCSSQADGASQTPSVEKSLGPKGRPARRSACATVTCAPLRRMLPRARWYFQGWLLP